MNSDPKFMPDLKVYGIGPGNQSTYASMPRVIYHGIEGIFSYVLIRSPEEETILLLQYPSAEVVTNLRLRAVFLQKAIDKGLINI